MPVVGTKLHIPAARRPVADLRQALVLGFPAGPPLAASWTRRAGAGAATRRRHVGQCLMRSGCCMRPSAGPRRHPSRRAARPARTTSAAARARGAAPAGHRPDRSGDRRRCSSRSTPCAPTPSTSSPSSTSAPAGPRRPGSGGSRPPLIRGCSRVEGRVVGSRLTMIIYARPARVGPRAEPLRVARCPARPGSSWMVMEEEVLPSLAALRRGRRPGWCRPTATRADTELMLDTTLLGTRRWWPSSATCRWRTPRRRPSCCPRWSPTRWCGT